jgi:hypothetical protein
MLARGAAKARFEAFAHLPSHDACQVFVAAAFNTSR